MNYGPCGNSTLPRYHVTPFNMCKCIWRFTYSDGAIFDGQWQEDLWSGTLHRLMSTHILSHRFLSKQAFPIEWFSRTGYTARAWQSLLLETVTKEAGRTAGFTGMVCYLRALRSSSMTVHDGPWKMKVALQVLWPTQTKISMKGIGCALSKRYFSFMLWRTEVQLEAGWSWPPHANSRHDGKMHGRGTYKYAGRQDWLRWPCFATLVWINLSKRKIEEGGILDSPACQPVGPVGPVEPVEPVVLGRRRRLPRRVEGRQATRQGRGYLCVEPRSNWDSFDRFDIVLWFNLWCLFDVFWKWHWDALSLWKSTADVRSAPVAV